MDKKEVPIPKYSIGDTLLVKGSQLEIERCLTVRMIQIIFKNKPHEPKYEISYSFDESIWWHREDEIIREVKV